MAVIPTNAALSSRVYYPRKVRICGRSTTMTTTRPADVPYTDGLICRKRRLIVRQNSYESWLWGLKGHTNGCRSSEMKVRQEYKTIWQAIWPRAHIVCCQVRYRPVSKIERCCYAVPPVGRTRARLQQPCSDGWKKCVVRLTGTRECGSVLYWFSPLL